MNDMGYGVCNCCKLWRKETVMFSIINIFSFLFPLSFPFSGNDSEVMSPLRQYDTGSRTGLLSHTSRHQKKKKKKKKKIHKILRETFVIIMDIAFHFNLFCVFFFHCCPLFLLLYNQICWCICRNASCMFDKCSRSTCC